VPALDRKSGAAPGDSLEKNAVSPVGIKLSTYFPKAPNCFPKISLLTLIFLRRGAANAMEPPKNYLL
jgi:hypothetical protein